MMRILIKGGHVIDPASKLDKPADICMAEGKIISVGKRKKDFDAEQTIDASNKIVCPGLVDLSARFREPGQEHKTTIAKETLAAASAGVTSICYPPDTEPVIDTPAVVDLIHHRATEFNHIRIYPLAALTLGLKGEVLAEIQTLQEAGCVGVSNAHQALQNTEILRRAMEYAASCGMTIHICAEDYALRNNGVIHEGAMSTRLGLPAIAETVETIAVSQALLLIEQTGVKAHFCRLSTAKSVEMITQAKKSGLPVSADVGITHLHLTEMDVDGYNTNCHLNPPLRTQRDKEALLQGLIDGYIDAICSDHQPHDTDAKAAPFAETEAGASTIEHLLPLVFDFVNKEKISLSSAIAAITCKPAQIMGIEAGTLKTNQPADLIIIDPDQTWTVDTNTLLSEGKNTPFAAWEMSARVTHTFLNGNLIYTL